MTPTADMLDDHFQYQYEASFDSILVRAESYDSTVQCRQKRTAKPLAHAKELSAQYKPKTPKYGNKKKAKNGGGRNAVEA